MTTTVDNNLISIVTTCTVSQGAGNALSWIYNSSPKYAYRVLAVRGGGACRENIAASLASVELRRYDFVQGETNYPGFDNTTIDASDRRSTVHGLWYGDTVGGYSTSASYEVLRRGIVFNENCTEYWQNIMEIQAGAPLNAVIPRHDSRFTSLVTPYVLRHNQGMMLVILAGTVTKGYCEWTLERFNA